MAEATKPRKQPRAKPLTVAEYVDAYLRQPIEVANGEVIEMSPPNLRHVNIAHYLYDLLRPWVEERRLGRVFIEVPYLLDASERKDWVKGARVPDVSFVARERMQTHLDKYGEEGPLRLTPDLAVEIVSPSDKYTDVNQKVADYLRYGVRLVWVIDPTARTIRVYTPGDPDGHTLSEKETLTGDPLLAGWSASIAAVLDGPPPSGS